MASSQELKDIGKCYVGEEYRSVISERLQSSFDYSTYSIIGSVYDGLDHGAKANISPKALRGAAAADIDINPKDLIFIYDIEVNRDIPKFVAAMNHYSGNGELSKKVARIDARGFIIRGYHMIPVYTNANSTNKSVDVHTLIDLAKGDKMIVFFIVTFTDGVPDSTNKPTHVSLEVR